MPSSELSSASIYQVFRQSDSAILLLTFDVLDIVARSSTALPVPTDSIILEGALGGFVAADANTIYYGSGVQFELILRAILMYGNVTLFCMHI